MKARELSNNAKQLAVSAALAGAMLLVLSGCGGGGGSSATPPAGAITNTASAGPVSISFTLPAYAAGTSKVRASQSVPSSMNGIAVYAYAASGSQPSTPTLVGDLSLSPTGGNKSLCVAASGGRLCTITFSAPLGADIIAVQFYDAEPSGGAIPASANLVASGTASLNVGANGANSATIVLNSVAASFNGASGGSLPALQPTATGSIAGGNFSLSLPAGAVSGNVQVGVSEVLQLLLPLSTQRHPQYTAGAGNTLVYAFGITFLPAVTLSSSMSLSAPTATTFQITGSLASLLSATGTLSVAQLTGNTYTDVGSLTYTFSGGTLTITGGTAGILTSGIYAIYIPAPGTVSTGSSSASSTGAIAVLTVSGTTNAYVPTSGGLLQVALSNGTSLASSTRKTAFAPQPVDSCTADSVHSMVYCIQFSGTNIYPYNVSGGSISPGSPIATNASSLVGFSGGTCMLCGIVYDGLQNDLIISTNTGYEVCPTSGSCATPIGSVAAPIAENFGYNAATRQLFSPYYTGGNYSNSSTTGVQLISLATNSSPAAYTMSNPPSGIAGPDHGAIDVATGIAVTTNECNNSACSVGGSAQAFLFGLGSASSGGSSFTAPSQPATLTSTALSTSGCPYATDGITVDSNAHLAFFASEFCNGVIGVARMPATSGSGLSFSDWVFTTMPSTPNGTWSDNHDPHTITTFSLPGVCTDCAVIASLDKSYLAVIDLNQFLSASRAGTDGHTVSSSVILTSASSGNAVITFVWTGIGCQSACSTNRAPQGIQRQSPGH